MQDLYTFIMEFDGGTYIYQYRGASSEDAMIRWIKDLDPKEINVREDEIDNILKNIELLEKRPNPIEGLRNVWCMGFELDSEYALIHIIKTSDSE